MTKTAPTDSLTQGTKGACFHRYRVAAALIVILAIGFALRVWQLPNESPWYDEIVALRHISAPSLAEFIRLERAEDPPMTPVYFTLAYAWAHLTSTSTVSLRMLSVLLGMGSILTMFLLGRRLNGVVAGLIAALALAVAMPHIYFSQEVRVYSLVILLALMSMFFFVQALQNNRRASWILHTTCNLLLVFTHLFTAYIFAVQWCYLVLFRRSALRAWTLAHGVIAVLLLLWLKTVDMPQLDGAASWIVQPGLRELVMVLLIFIGGRPSNASPVNHLPTNISLDIPLALAAMVVIGVFVIKTGISKEDSSAKKDKKAVVLLLLWALLPFVALVAMSFLWRPCFVYRYILYSSLPLYLMLGAGFSTMRNKRLACVLGAALMLVWAHQLSAITTGPFRADWRSASRYLEQNANPNDTVVVFQRFNVESLEFNSTLPEDQIEPVDVWSAICDPVTAAQQKGEAYLVVRMWSDPAKIEACFPENSLAFTYTDFKGWPALRVYHITRDHGAAAQ